MQNLSELLACSSSTRKYFVTLPVWLQMELHNHYNDIKTADRLHIVAEILKAQEILKW